MPLPDALRIRLEDVVDALKTKVVSRQNTYFAVHGRYWQGARILSVTPDGTETAVDGTRKPSDQNENWSDFLGVDLPATLPVALRIDTYDGPQGKGYTVTAEVTYNAKTWARTWNVGPETWRAVAWHQID
jgi:hypothetical protein